MTKSSLRGDRLDQNVGASGVGPYCHRLGNVQQIVAGKLVEWRETAEKIGDLFHGTPSSAFLIP
jgi:hypothetical protein